MEYFVIEGGHRLGGTITPVGNKNAALPLLAVALLTDEPLILHNVPNIGDVRIKRELIQRLGVECADLGNGSWRLQTRAVDDRQPAVAEPVLTDLDRVAVVGPAMLEPREHARARFLVASSVNRGDSAHYF